MKTELPSVVLATKRLLIRPIVREDAEFILRLLNQPSWLEFIGDKKVYNLNDAKKYIELELIEMYQRHGFGLFLVCDKHTTMPMGLCGLIKRDNFDYADLGYAFLPKYWRQGFALEAAKSIIDYAKQRHQLTKILALCKASNTASIKLLNKVGFVFDSDLKLLENEESLQIYQLQL